jgi:hypothetical protein
MFEIRTNDHLSERRKFRAEDSVSLTLHNQSLSSLSDPIWPNGTRCAISFAYIGGFVDHLKVGLPLLDELGFSASFFVSAEQVLPRAKAWKEANLAGHEVGCTSFDDLLLNWGADAVTREVAMDKEFADTFFNRKSRGYAFQSASNHHVSNRFDFAISNSIASNNLSTNISEISTYPVKHFPDPYLEAIIKSEDLNWIVIPFRKLYSHDSDDNAHGDILLHRQVLEFIHKNRKNLWVAPVGMVASELKSRQNSENSL